MRCFLVRGRGKRLHFSLDQTPFFFFNARILPCSVKAACVINPFSPVRLFVTPWTLAHQAPLSMGFSRQESWRGFPCPPPGDLPNPGVEPVAPVSAALAGGFSTAEPRGKPLVKADLLLIPSLGGISRSVSGFPRPPSPQPPPQLAASPPERSRQVPWRCRFCSPQRGLSTCDPEAQTDKTPPGLLGQMALCPPHSQRCLSS